MLFELKATDIGIKVLQTVVDLKNKTHQLEIDLASLSIESRSLAKVEQLEQDLLLLEKELFFSFASKLISVPASLEFFLPSSGQIVDKSSQEGSTPETYSEEEVDKLAEAIYGKLIGRNDLSDIVESVIDTGNFIDYEEISSQVEHSIGDNIREELLELSEHFVEKVVAKLIESESFWKELKERVFSRVLDLVFQKSSVEFSK